MLMFKYQPHMRIHSSLPIPGLYASLKSCQSEFYLESEPPCMLANVKCQCNRFVNA